VRVKYHSFVGPILVVVISVREKQIFKLEMTIVLKKWASNRTQGTVSFYLQAPFDNDLTNMNWL
jgi:hypothetical protein